MAAKIAGKKVIFDFLSAPDQSFRKDVLSSRLCHVWIKEVYLFVGFI